MLFDDPRGTAKLYKRRRVKRARATLSLDVPQPLHHELEERGLDPAAILALGDDPAPLGDGDLPCRDLVEDGLDELRLRLARLLPPQCERGERPHDRVATLLPGQVVEAQEIPEEARDPRLERVELRQRIVADAEEHADPEARAA